MCDAGLRLVAVFQSVLIDSGFPALMRVAEAAGHADHPVCPGVGLAAATASVTSVICTPDSLGHQ